MQTARGSFVIVHASLTAQADNLILHCQPAADVYNAASLFNAYFNNGCQRCSCRIKKWKYATWGATGQICFPGAR